MVDATDKIRPVDAGAGPQLRNSIDRNFEILDARSPAITEDIEEGSVLTIVDGKPTWVAPAGG